MATALEEFIALSGDRPAAISYQRLSPEIQITSKLWSTSALPNTQGTERCISYIIITCYLPVFLSLYESFWKGFQSDRLKTVNLAGLKCLFLSNC